MRLRYEEKQTALDLLDRRSLAVTKSIRLHTSETYDLALHPKLRVAYVALHDEALPTDSSMRSRRVVTVDETTGATAMVPDVYGQWVVADPLGRRLYVGVHQLYQNGYRLNFDFDFGDAIMPTYGSIDLLGVLPLHDGVPQRGKATTNPGENGSGVRVAPDGLALSYVCGAGRPSLSYAIPSLSPDNLDDPLTTYVSKVDGGGPYPVDLCYHPTLPLVAMATREHVQLFNRATGDRLDDRIGQLPKLQDLDRVFFSPDGKSIVVDPVVETYRPPPGERGERKSGRRLFSVQMKLTDAELALLAKPTPPPAASVPAPKVSTPSHRAPADDTDPPAKGTRA